MLMRLAILGFMAAAVATLLDRGTLWEFTLDPERRLTMVAYWTLHTLLLVLIVLAYRLLTRPKRPTPIVLLTILGIASIGFVFGGLLVADVYTLVRLVFLDNAPGVIAFVVGALLVRMIWRMFSNPEPLLIKRNDNADEPTWGDALNSIAMVPVVVIVFFVLIALLSSTWQTASLVLDYALLGRDPTTIEWWDGLQRIAFYVAHWEILAFVAGAMIVAVVMEKLFAKPTKGPTDSAQ